MGQMYYDVIQGKGIYITPLRDVYRGDLVAGKFEGCGKDLSLTTSLIITSHCQFNCNATNIFSGMESLSFLTVRGTLVTLYKDFDMVEGSSRKQKAANFSAISSTTKSTVNTS